MEKFIYFQLLVNLSEGRWKTDEELFVEIKKYLNQEEFLNALS